MDVDFVYFDLDDTLLDHRAAEREALADVRNRYLEVFGTLSVDELQDTYDTINSPLWRRYAAGGIDKSTVQQQRFEDLTEAVGAGHADAGLIGRYYMERYAEHWQFVDGAREAYERVAEDYPVGVLTNGFAEVQAKKFERFPVLREKAEAVVVSEEVGVMKPDPEIFAYATDRAGVGAGRILYVGDSYHSDVEGGQQAGWRVAWFVRPNAGDDATADRTVDDRGFVFSDWSDFCARLFDNGEGET